MPREIFADKGVCFVYFPYQVAKIPQIVQQQPTVANIQQIVSSAQQVGLPGLALILKTTADSSSASY